MAKSTCTTLILDLGDVLVNWSPGTQTAVPAKALKKMISSTIWSEYECGGLSEDCCYEKLGSAFGFSTTEIREAMEAARSSLQLDQTMYSAVCELKKAYSLRIFALSNMSVPDYAVVEKLFPDRTLFDGVFISGAVRMRKPDLRFFRHMLEQTQTVPQRAIFVDDKIDNVVSARSLGIKGLVCTNTLDTIRELLNALGDPVKRGKQFLHLNAKGFSSTTAEGDSFYENWSQLMILDITKDLNLVSLEKPARLWQFFIGKPLLSPSSDPDIKKFPADLDTTSVALTVVPTDPANAHSIMNEMLEYLSPDGLVLTYFDHTRPRLCPVVEVNILCLFALHNRLHDLQPALSWLHGILLHRAYLDGSRYYSSPDLFCYLLARLLRRSPPSPNSPPLYAQLLPLLITRLAERRGLAGDALSLAMRVVACNWNGIVNEVDLERLRALQMEDGGWEAGELYRYPSSGLPVGNRGVTTALAVQALEEAGSRAETPMRALQAEAPKPGLRAKTPRPAPRGRRSRRAITGSWVEAYDGYDGYKESVIGYATSVLMATLVSLFLILSFA